MTSRGSQVEQRKVVVWGTGNVGRPSVRAVVADPGLELVGVVVSNPDKEGKDAAELCELSEPTVVYTATGDTRPDDALADVLRCLRAGADVVSTSIYPLIHPGSTPPEMKAEVEAACAEGGASVWVSGIDPGFGADLLAPMVVGACVSVDKVVVREVFNYATYHAPHAVKDLVGFGMPMDQTPPMLWPTVPTLERTVELPIGTFEAGTQGAFRLQVRGLVGGEEKIVMDHVTRIDDECAPDWPVPPEQSMGCHQVLVTGDPDVALTLTAEDADGDRNVGGIAMSAGRIVHALHAVADAPNRIITAMDVPLVPGKGLLK